jgi:hypothetical protein
MSYRGHEPSTPFDFASLDDEEVVDLDHEFWAAQSQLLNDLLIWATAGRSLEAAGARLYVLCLYLRPQIVNKCSLRQIAAMRGAPGVSALSKALIELQQKYALKPSYFQKPLWARERFRRSQIAVHQQRAAQ